MEEYTIECAVCNGAFGSDKEYTNHKCIDEDEDNGSSVKIKQEILEAESDAEAEMPTNENESPYFENIKCENMEDNEEEEMVNDIDPLSFPLLNQSQIKEEQDLEAVKESYLDVLRMKLGTEGKLSMLVDDVEEETVRNIGSALSGKCLSRYNCKLCGATFDRKDKFTKHFREAHNSYRPFECSVCKKKFLHKHYVNLHMRVHTGEKPYVCTLCPKAYSHKTSFTIHMRIHNGERPYGCNVCGKKCYDKSGLTSHMRSHTKETPYQCEVCGRRFTHSKSLLVHRRNHTGEKPYICSYCGKAFRHWHKHKIHVRLHTGERPYKCKVCGKGFPRNDEVSRHMRSHQGIKSFKCSICSIYCATQASITGHINLHHSNLKTNDHDLPEKTLVKNGTSGILGTKVPEPRSFYKRIIPEPPLGDSNEDVVPSTSKETSLGTSSTRVIEVISQDTPFTLQKKVKKIINRTSLIMPKKSTPSSDEGSKDAKQLSYQTFLEWQERMFANQGLIVKGYSDSTNSKFNPKPEAKNIINGTKVMAVPTSSLPPAPQYLLLTQGIGEKATKILVPINMPHIADKSKSQSQPEGVGASSKPMYFMQPNAKNQPMLLVSNQGGQKMIILAPQSGLTPLNASPTPTKVMNIKEEPHNGDSEDEAVSFTPNVVVKTERGSPPSSPPLNMILQIKQEPGIED